MTRRWTALGLGLIAAGSLAAAAPAAAPTRTVRIGEYFFKPGKLTVPAGTTVTWKWVGMIKHNVSVKQGPVKFHSRTQLHGTYGHAFTRRGTYLLHCTIHPFMKETVVVS